MKYSRLRMAAFTVLLAATVWLVWRWGAGAFDPATEPGLEPGPVAESADSSSTLPPAERREAVAESREELRTSAPAAAVLARVPEAGADAPLRGRLLDAWTDEALPHYLLEAVLEDQTHLVVETDEAGLFTLELPKDPPLEKLLFIDDRRVLPRWTGVRPANELDLPVADEEWLTKVRVGPTYHLELTAPPNRFGAFRALVLNTDQLDRIDEGFDGWLTTPIRGGERPWIRFPERIFANESGPWWVFVLSNGGFHWGRSTAVTSIQGVHPGVVEVNFFEGGRVTGRVLGPDEQPLPEVWVFLNPDSSDPTSPGPDTLSSLLSDETGGFCFEWRPPGDYSLGVHSPRHEPATTPVSIVAGETLEQDLHLRPLVSGGSIRGRIISRTGQYRGYVSMHLAGQTPPRRRFSFHTTMQETEDRVAADFVFEDVPEGEYELQVHVGHLIDVTPTPLAVRPPAEGLELFIEDAVDLLDYGFVVLDSATGEPIPEFEVHLSGAGRELSTVTGGASGQPAIESIPANKPVHWMVVPKGYVPAWGDVTSFVGDGRERFAELHLARGWGVQLNVRSQGAPLAGVVVLLDGVEVGASDADGIARLTAPAMPAKVELRYRGWKRFASDDLDEEGRVRGEFSVFWIEMRPPR